MLTKLSVAIKREYAAPYPDRKTALAHFRERYHVEKRGKLWYVDFTVPKLVATGNARADAILRRLNQRG